MRCQQEPRFALSGASNICSAALPETSRTALSFAPVYMFLSLRKAMPVTCSHLHVQRTDCSILRPFAAEMNATVDSWSHQSRQTSLMVKQRLSTDKTCFTLSLVDARVAIAARSRRRCSAARTHRGASAIRSPWRKSAQNHPLKDKRSTLYVVYHICMLYMYVCCEMSSFSPLQLPKL